MADGSGAAGGSARRRRLTEPPSRPPRGDPFSRAAQSRPMPRKTRPDSPLSFRPTTPGASVAQAPLLASPAPPLPPLFLSPARPADSPALSARSAPLRPAREVPREPLRARHGTGNRVLPDPGESIPTAGVSTRGAASAPTHTWLHCLLLLLSCFYLCFIFIVYFLCIFSFLYNFSFLFLSCFSFSSFSFFPFSFFLVVFSFSYFSSYFFCLYRFFFFIFPFAFDVKLTSTPSLPPTRAAGSPGRGESAAAAQPPRLSPRRRSRTPEGDQAALGLSSSMRRPSWPAASHASAPQPPRPRLRARAPSPLCRRRCWFSQARRNHPLNRRIHPTCSGKLS